MIRMLVVSGGDVDNNAQYHYGDDEIEKAKGMANRLCATLLSTHHVDLFYCKDISSPNERLLESFRGRGRRDGASNG